MDVDNSNSVEWQAMRRSTAECAHALEAPSNAPRTTCSLSHIDGAHSQLLPTARPNREYSEYS